MGGALTAGAGVRRVGRRPVTGVGQSQDGSLDARIADAAACALQASLDAELLGCPPMPLPVAPAVGVAAVRAARARLAAVAHASAWAPLFRAARTAHAEQRCGLTARQRAALDRVCVDWVLCDVGAHDAIAYRLANDAEADGLPEVGAALRAMGDSHLLTWRVATPPLRQALPGVYLARHPDHACAPVVHTGLREAPPPGTVLHARLWPAGAGRWALAPGVLLRAELPMAGPQPDHPEVSSANAQLHVMTVLDGWIEELARLRALDALLPAA